MADEWRWSTQRSHGASACSIAPLLDTGACGWTSPTSVVAESTSSVTFQDPLRSSSTHQPLSDAASSICDPQMDWTQAFLTGRTDASFRGVLQDDMAASTAPFRAQPTADGDMRHGFLLDQVPPTSSPYGTVPFQFQGMLDAVAPAATARNISMSGDCQSSASYDATASMQLLQTPTQMQGGGAQLSESYLPFGVHLMPQLLLQALQPKASCSSNALVAKSNSGSAQQACSSVPRKIASDSPVAAKRPRIEAPSPMPTFKVRKEKLGDRITALQQLVSPFGKTDTASVLHEANEYIKFLHNQVASLTSPYLRNGNSLQQFQQKGSENVKDSCETKKDLRSRGLCLVPVATTYTVASESAVSEFWYPTFGGTFR